MTETAVRKIAFLGGESTGKTSLCRLLSEHLGEPWVPEYGRELTERQANHVSYEDLLAIGIEQIRREDRAMAKAKKWLICDTTPLTTMFYSKALYGQVNPRLVELAKRPYDFTFLCDRDTPFVQDGHRANETFRDIQQEWYLKELDERGIFYRSVSGSLEHRVAKVITVLTS